MPESRREFSHPSLLIFQDERESRFLVVRSERYDVDFLGGGKGGG